MNDYDYLQAYLAEPERAAEPEPKGELIPFPKAPSESPVTVNVPDKTSEIIEARKEGKSKGFFKTASGVKKKAEKTLGAAVPSLDDLPTPPTSGVGLLLFISLLVVFAIMPSGTDGQTRLGLLWGSILGNYSLKRGGNPQASGNPRNPSGTIQKNPLPPDPLDPWGIQGGLT
jgi:hypothetical protein